MFTRCPECQSVHALNASLLAHSMGTVRCGKCDCQYNALAHLFDHWPNSDSRPPKTGAGPPVLGARDENTEPRASSESFPVAPGDGAERDDSSRVAWITVFVILALVTVANLAWTFRQPLLENKAVQTVLSNLGLIALEPEKPFRDVSKIHLVSRDLHDHPAREGLLVLSATFVNRAARAQPYPNIHLTLSDDANQPLAERLFTPADYLPGGAPNGLLEPMVHVPVLLEFVDPGDSAVGFELEFE